VAGSPAFPARLELAARAASSGCQGCGHRLWRHNMALGAQVAIPLGILLAAAGVIGFSAWNKRRKAAVKV